MNEDLKLTQEEINLRNRLKWKIAESSINDEDLTVTRKFAELRKRHKERKPVRINLAQTIILQCEIRLLSFHDRFYFFRNLKRKIMRNQRLTRKKPVNKLLQYIKFTKITVPYANKQQRQSSEFFNSSSLVSGDRWCKIIWNIDRQCKNPSKLLAETSSDLLNIRNSRTDFALILTKTKVSS